MDTHEHIQSWMLTFKLWCEQCRQTDSSVRFVMVNNSDGELLDTWSLPFIPKFCGLWSFLSLCCLWKLLLGERGGACFRAGERGELVLGQALVPVWMGVNFSLVGRAKAHRVTECGACFGFSYTVGHTSTADTHNIMYNSESPYCLSIHLRNL